jgi:hypothetical protein
MPYLEIPLATDTPSVSQGEILSNFQNLNIWTDVDHYNVGSVNAGKHLQVTLPNIAVIPVAAANESIVFGALSAITGLPELYRSTSAGYSNMTEASATGNGFSRLASGIMIKWGGVATVASPATVTMDVSDVFTTVFAVYVTPLSIANADPGYSVYPVDGSFNLPANQFDVVAYDFAGAAVAVTNFSYLVIGV